VPNRFQVQRTQGLNISSEVLPMSLCNAMKTVTISSEFGTIYQVFNIKRFHGGMYWCQDQTVYHNMIMYFYDTRRYVKR
jgi:hypothetical protein